MGSPPGCTMIVQTYDRIRLLELTLDALTRQSLPPDEFEVLVVDDGSSDATAAAAEPLALNGYVDCSTSTTRTPS
ncbi:MAG TPA: glycosyltransferase family A protein [Actinophytocola sp.]|uniref:glycosyltransferase family 2 protein n=1 Tax=Actinophytocola sp. TaxID=1872138 RepID=UPI002DB9E05D|nr:glycosyltransferase family A protein [Actinophytocola sp.]HEU5475315.1 glycosyltransferase family A protein [Actinophytocola sp.]